ncbi:MAG: TraR/DksA C4-type zinc finger protein [Piscinibacter sp.]|nr:TraR/DksA C4-type zinc finger protein [Piscinibacter sp.]MBP6636071.1 TraR/DksA C4-type zinc finger protein [Sulfuritalea sp.]
MDEHDIAQDLAQRERDAALAAHRRAHPPAALDWRTASAKWCIEPCCGERIPDERRRAIPGVQRCVDCQQRADQLKKQHRRGYA